MKKMLSVVITFLMLFSMLVSVGFGEENDQKSIPILNGNFESTSTTNDGEEIEGWTYYYYMASTNETISAENASLGTYIEARIASSHTAVTSGWDGKAIQFKGANQYSVFAFSDMIEIPQDVLGKSRVYTLDFKLALTASTNARGRAAILYYKSNPDTGKIELYNNGVYKSIDETQGVGRWQTKDAEGKNSYTEIIDGLNTWRSYSLTSLAPSDAEYIQVAIGVHGTAAQRLFYDNITLSYSSDITPPDEISELSAYGINEGIYLSWINPEDEDFIQTLITVDGITYYIDKNINEYTITGLTNGMTYEVSIKTKDKNYNISPGITFEVTPVAPDVNMPPEVVNPIGSVSIWADEIFQLDVSDVFYDSNFDPLVLSVDKGTLSGNILTYIPAEGDTTVIITLSANDGTDVSSDIITLTVLPVPNEQPDNIDDFYFLKVKNPGFERVSVNPVTGKTENNPEIIGWSVGYNPLTATTNERLFYYVGRDIAGKEGQALFSFDQDNYNGQVHASELIPAAPQNVYQQVAYQLQYQYKSRFPGIDGSTITGTQYGAAMTFYNEQGQIWTNSGWSTTVNADSNIYTQFSTGKVISGGAGDGTYSHLWYTNITENDWNSRTDTRVAPVGTAFVRVYFAGSSSQAYIFAIDDVKVGYQKTYGTVTVTTLTNGEEGNTGGTVTAGGTVGIGETCTITATPNSGYVIDYIKFNGIEVVSSHTGEKIYTTPAITGADEIEVNFIEERQAVKSISLAKTFTEKEDNIPTVIAFGIAKDRFGSYERKEFGMIFSKTNSNPEIGGDDCITAKGEVLPNALGQYGIRFIGKGIISGNTYYARAYAIYKKADEVITEYGDLILLMPE